MAYSSEGQKMKTEGATHNKFTGFSGSTAAFHYELNIL